MTQRARDRLCWASSILVLLVGVGIWATGRQSVGLVLESDTSGRPVVADVMTGSLGWVAGAEPGMIVTLVDWNPPVAAFTGAEGHDLRLLDERTGRRLEVASYTTAYALLLPALWLAVALLAGSWSTWRRLPGRSLSRDFVAPFALASVMPLALVPAAAFVSPGLLALSGLLWPLSVLPLALTIAGEASTPAKVERARGLAVAAVVAAVAIVPLFYLVPAPAGGWLSSARDLLVAFALIGPVAFVAPGLLRESGAWDLSWQPLARALAVAAIAATPPVIHVALAAPTVGLAIGGLVLWLTAGIGVTRFVVVPLSGLVTRAVRQRDLVAAAADAERRRIAADLHDGPLQSLTLLAYRLDSAGDIENAGLARDVVTELRAITSALRLPVVDDLGAGLALEWLTTQVGRLSGQEIQLLRADVERPPIDVEHAVFRIAQEALANATRHGRPPIRIRYDAAAGRASLTVDDAGAGLAAVDAAAADERGLGLVGMRERAHSIGAAFEIGLSPGGSRVSLVWPAAPATSS